MKLGWLFPSRQFHTRLKACSQARNVTKHRLVLDIYSSPLMPATPRGFLEVVVFKKTILQMGC